MKQEIVKNQKGFCSLNELEKYYFPMSYQKNLNKKKESKSFGAHLAKEIIHSLKNELSR